MPTSTTTRAAKVIARCQRFASFTEDAGSIRRTFLSRPMHDCHRELSGWMEALGAQSHIDAAGNFRSVYPASQLDAPRILIGSHLDTVPRAGAYDGVLGLVVAVALLEALQGKRLPFAIEVVGFSEEEGVRFGAPFIGSRALVGRLDEEILKVRDAQGVSVRQAISAFGLNPEKIPQARLGEDALAYLEFHIEQGPVLDQLNQPLAAVEAIAGQSRLEVTFLGHANHAGTTPMHLRHDAIAGAAEWIIAIEKIAASIPSLVATVGRIEAKPGSTNVVAGETKLSLDVRHGSDSTRTRTVEDLLRSAQEIAIRRGLSVQSKVSLDQRAVAMNPLLVAEIEHAIQAIGSKSHRMVSGAGHDAMILAEKLPAAMIFLRSPGGISHDPAESVIMDDIEKAIDCGLQLLDQLAADPHLLNRLSQKG